MIYERPGLLSVYVSEDLFAFYLGDGGGGTRPKQFSQKDLAFSRALQFGLFGVCYVLTPTII